MAALNLLPGDKAVKISTLESLLEAQARRDAVAVVTRLETGDQQIVRLAEVDRSPYPDILRDGFRFDRSGVHQTGGGEIFVNIHNPQLQLIIIGAVHIAQSLAPMAAAAGYRVTVIDPRGAFATEERFPGTDVRAEWPDEVLPDMVLDHRTAFAALAHDYALGGRPGAAIPLLGALGDNLGVGELISLATAFSFSGDLRNADATARRALLAARDCHDRDAEARSLIRIGLTEAARGSDDRAGMAIERAARIWRADEDQRGESTAELALAVRALWLGKPGAAQPHADRSALLATASRVALDLVRAAGLQGRIAVQLDDLVVAGDRLSFALTQARTLRFVEEEIRALVGLVDLHRRRGEPDHARALLADVWPLAERGPYPRFLADAQNVLTKIERESGNQQAAVTAARSAYRHAWGNGPPYAFHRGLEEAQSHLVELGARPPELPPFDPTAYEQLPDVDLDPPDERAPRDTAT